VAVESVAVVEEVIAPSQIDDPWQEKYNNANVDADGWGEVVRIPSHNPDTPIQNAPETTEAEANEQTPQPTHIAATGNVVEAAPLPQQFKVGNRVKVLEGNWKGKNGVITKFENKMYSVKRECGWDFAQLYLEHQIELIQSRPSPDDEVEDEI